MTATHAAATNSFIRQFDPRGYEKYMAKARGVTNREFNAIERHAKQLNCSLGSNLA